MLVQQDQLDTLFSEVAGKVRSSPMQPRDAVVQLSLRRLRVNERDAEAVHVIAAADLTAKNPSGTLNALQRWECAIEGKCGWASFGWLRLAFSEPSHRSTSALGCGDPNRSLSTRLLDTSWKDLRTLQPNRYGTGVLFSRHEAR